MGLTDSRYLHNSRGFTFLEVMIAVAIIAIVFTASLKMVSQTLSLRSMSRFYSVAPYLASDATRKMETEHFKNTGMSGDFGTDFSGWTWKASSVQVSGENLPAWADNLYRIDLSVKYLPDNLVHSVTFYRFLPEQ